MSPARKAVLAAAGAGVVLLPLLDPLIRARLLNGILFQPGCEVLLSRRLALTGQADGSRCGFFPAARKRMGGMLGHSLERAIAARDFMLIAKERDAWGCCDGGTPMVVVPLTTLHNWFAPRDVPPASPSTTGPAASCGSWTPLHPGTCRARRSPSPRPISQAERINDCLQTYGGSPWSTLLVQSGLTDQPKDWATPTWATSPTPASPSAGGEGCVSPFTSRASSCSIDVVTVLDSARATAGRPAGVAELHRRLTAP